MNSLGDILILGMGRSGLAVAHYAVALLEAGVVSSVTALDGSESPVLLEAATRLSSAGVSVSLGSTQVTGRFDLCIASPGIPLHSSLMISARSVCTRIISELEFAYSQSTQPWVAITGTNGKTTTTALVTHLLTEGGLQARSVGNIGTAAISAVAEAAPSEVLVAEVSSFQLALTETFHPHVAVLLNVTPDHVDWHGSYEAYVADKARVLGNLDDTDVAVIDVDDPGSRPFAEVTAKRGIPVVRVSLSQTHSGGATLLDGMLALETSGGLIRLVRADQLQIKGSHNVSNALAAASVAHTLGVPAARIRSGLVSFRPIEHRLEPVGSFGGVEWFNDSKATNPDAVLKALDAFSQTPLIVLLGGRNKGNDFRRLAERVATTAKAAVLFGEARSELAEAFEGLSVHTVEAITLSDAVEAARTLASVGDSVVLSPACASFDEFSSYEDRGSSFKKLVASLAGAED